MPSRSGPRCGDDPEALAELAALPEADVVLNAVVGFAGLPATLAALEHGKRLALANKESLIAGGPVVNAVRARGGGEIVPVDSEHSAIYQALRSAAAPRGAPARPDRERRAVPRAGPAPSSRCVTVADALKHPTWDMGAKITIDSSTLMNKGLEVIEAHELFGVDYDQIDVVVHPQSVVHGMVEFTDGATIAQLSMPDMRLPIGLALGAPDRLDEPFGAIDWTDAVARSPSRRPTWRPSPACGWPTRPAGPGGGAPATLSGANEIAVEAFLARPDPVARHRRGQRRGPGPRDRERRRRCRRSGGRPGRTRARPGDRRRDRRARKRRVKDPLDDVQVAETRGVTASRSSPVHAGGAGPARRRSCPGAGRR